MPPQQETDTNPKPRPRSNTTTLFSWRNKPRAETNTHSAVPPPTTTQSVDELIELLSPPAVPSPGHARLLATALSSHTPIPRPASLNPIIACLCDRDAPIALQAAGYDLLAAYLSASQAVTGMEQQSYSLLLHVATPWSQELWQPRLRALYALSQLDCNVIEMQLTFLKLATSWIEGAFEGLFSHDALERAERERSIDKFSEFLDSLTERMTKVFRVREDELALLLSRYASMVERSLQLSSRGTSFESASSPTPELPGSGNSTPTKSLFSHRRHPSSSSLPLLSPLSSSSTLSVKLPTDVALLIYLKHLSFQMTVLSPVHLEDILPLLFRCLAYYTSPLPRLSLNSNSSHYSPSELEKRLIKTLYSLFTGPFASSCTILMKRYLQPQIGMDRNLVTFFELSFGAFRILRILSRTALLTRLAKAKFTDNYTPSGAPAQIDIGHNVMKYACVKEDLTGWEPARVGRILSGPVKTWINLDVSEDADQAKAPQETILDEVVGMLKDILEEFGEKGEDDERDVGEANAVGDILYQVVAYVRPLRNKEGNPLILPLKPPNDAPTPFLRSLSSILSRNSADTPIEPSLSIILLSIADHIRDTETAELLTTMHKQHDLLPISPSWLMNWEKILTHSSLYGCERPLTRNRVLRSLQSVYLTVKDIPSYRRPFADLVLDFWSRRMMDAKEECDGQILWRILGDEVVLRTGEMQVPECDDEDAPNESDQKVVDEILDLLVRIASTTRPYDDSSNSYNVNFSASPCTQSPLLHGTPVLSRVQSEYTLQSREKESSVPYVISMLSPFSTATMSRSQPLQRESVDDSTQSDSKLLPSSDAMTISNSVGAIMGLVSIFTQLAFTPRSLIKRDLELAVRVYEMLVQLLRLSTCSRARLTILQFLARLRADRDHRICCVDAAYDRDQHVTHLAQLIGRSSRPTGLGENDKIRGEENVHEISEARKAGVSMPPERDGRRSSRGRAIRTSTSTGSRSRSRATQRLPTQSLDPKPSQVLWHMPDHMASSLVEEDIPSEGLISYDDGELGKRVVLPVSIYLAALVEIIETEKDWEVMSYVLCHLPTQLANKHLFCGPNSRAIVVTLLKTLCNGISRGELARSIENWPQTLKARDAHGLAYHTLSVLISYRPCFDVQLQHAIVEVLLAGLNGQPSTIKCCLHALTLSAFELQPSMTRYLSKILEKLSQIMSNPAMAVHILDFLSMVASLPTLYANFTEADFKMVFGVALQYLQHHNRPGLSPSISWALSQHVRIICYYVVYVWFLAVKMPDRPRHVRFITRQLLLANEGRDEVDEPTEVCFDWLARYAYASADPRPANSLLNEIIMNPRVQQPSSETAISEKTWILGNSVITIRALAKLGWIEVISRRPSGSTKFLCRAENVPMVGPGDVDPDLISVPATLMVNRTAQHSSSTTTSGPFQDLQELVGDTQADEPPRPDPITGYVWSGSAPSQRRKEVYIDPSFFALQLSAYPDSPPRGRIVTDASSLPGFFRNFDKMPVIDTHKVGIMYVAHGQKQEDEILRNAHGSPAYTRFLEGIGRLINLRGQKDVYAGGLEPDEDGEYAYAWWDDIGQILYHTATMMPTDPEDKYYTNKKRHIGNDYVRIVWNDSGMPYRFDTLGTQFQFVNIVIEPHSRGAIAAFSNNIHENEYFKVVVQRAPGMTEFTPIGDFKLISAENLPLLVRQLSLLADWFASIFQHTQNDTVQVEVTTNWRSRLQAIRRFQSSISNSEILEPLPTDGLMRQEIFRDFTTAF